VTGRLALAGWLAATAASAPPQLPGFLGALSSPLQHYGLWAVFALVFLEDFGIPVPGETILIAGAVYAGSGGLNIVAVGVVGFVAAIAGDNVGYAIGRFGGHALAARWGKYIFLTPDRLEHAESFFQRHGGKIIVLARFIEGLRQANGIIAGISMMRWARFLFFNMIGAGLWVGCWVTIGYFAGEHITTIYDYITRYSLYVLIALAVAVIAWIGLRLRGKKRRQAAKAGKTDNGQAGNRRAGDNKTDNGGPAAPATRRSPQASDKP
jgi:membrane protein DedA with SNARE-associated domain